MDNLRFVLVITFVMLVVLMMQAWQIDYGPKPEVAAAVAALNQPSVKEDLPSTSASPSTNAVSSPVTANTQPSSKIITVKNGCL
jgi:hypothetical protein